MRSLIAPFCMPVLVLDTLLLLRMTALAVFLWSLFMSSAISPLVPAGIAVPRVTLMTIFLIMLSLLLIVMSTPRWLVWEWSWWRHRLSL